MSEDMFDDLVESGKVLPVRAIGSHPFDELGAVDSGAISGAVADKVNVGDEEVVGMGEALGEIVEQKSGSRMLMRLKHYPEPAFRVSLADSAKRYLDLSGMMAIVIEEKDPARLSANTETPIGPCKRAE
jgi:hypothetical protein